MINAFDLAAGRTWALSEDELLSVMTIAARLGEGPEAVSLRLGRPLENTRGTTVQNGVAVVPLDGPMFRRANLLTEISGATSTEAFAQDFQAAIDNPAVSAVVLDISSPGGEAAGVNEVAGAIHAARGSKPIVAYVGSMAASGAYWIASAADKIVMDATASVGSIGVVSRYVRQPDKPGVSVLEIVSTQSPNKRLSPETEAGRAAVQREVDSIAQVFVATVARNRGVSAEAVLSNFGQGGIEIGTEAVRRGMADSLGSLDGVIRDLATRSGGAGAQRRGAFTMADPVNPGAGSAAVMTAATLAAAHPDVAEALRAEGRALAAAGQSEALATARTEAAATERERIAGINDATLPGYEALARESTAAGHSPGDFALLQARAQRGKGSDHLAALRSDEAALAAAAALAPAVPAPAGSAAPAVDPEAPIEDRCRAEWDADKRLRAEFGENFGAFLSYSKANASGQVRILKGKE